MYDRSQESGYSGGGGFTTGQVHKELLRMPMILRVDLGASLWMCSVCENSIKLYPLRYMCIFLGVYFNSKKNMTLLLTKRKHSVL